MKKAFTLIELSISMGLLAIFLTIMSQVLFVILDTQTTSESVTNVEMDAQYIINRLIYDIHTSTNINAVISNYSLDNQNLSYLGIRLNGPDTQITDFTILKVENTAKVNFTLVSREETRSYQTSVGIR